MDMVVVQEEAPHEELLASSDPDSECAQAVVKGKRSKRLRGHHVRPAMSSSSSGSLTEEEEDMANCLILLASGRGPPGDTEDYAGARGEPPAAKAGPPCYECRTCGKCFRSFQALGGHRTSHKKPKTTAVPVQEEKAKACRDAEGLLQMRIAPSYDDHVPMEAAAAAAKPRVHECSICGSEFASGQALGGHMRRHRPVPPPPPAPPVGSPGQPKKERSVLSLDLNLPAPPEDDHVDYAKSPGAGAGAGGGFGFPNKPPPPPIIALVDCHY